MISPQPLLTANQINPNSSNINLASNSSSEPSFFNATKQVTSSYQQNCSQQKNYEKPSILIAQEVKTQQAIGAILDLKQSAKSIGDTLIYIFSQFIDHVSSAGTSVDFDFIKSQWNILKTHLQPFNQQKITEYFKQANNSSRTQSYSSSYRNLSEQVSNIDSNLNLMNYNNDTSLDTAMPPKSMPTSTRNKQQSLNTQNTQENITNPNEIAKAFIIVQDTNSSNQPNLFLNSCQSPSAPSLLPQTISSHTPPPVNISQYQIQSQNCIKSVNSQPIISNPLQFNQGRDDAISPSYTIASVSRCNSFTTTNYPQVSNFEINSAYNINANSDINTCTASTQNNQFQSEVKKENIQGQHQTISITSRSKKDGNWSQYKAVPISTFKLEVPRMNKHMHQNSQNNYQGIQSQTSIVCNENEQQQQVADSSQTQITQIQSNQPNSTFKRGNSQYEKRMKSSSTNFQQHHTFLQQQRESLARQTSQSQEKSSITKLMYDSKSQTLVQVNNNDSHKQNQQINEFNQQKILNNNQVSPKQIKKQLQQQQLLLQSQQSLTSNQNLNSNFNSINFLASPIVQSQQNQGISVHSSSSLSQKAFNQILQQQQITAITSNSHQNIQNKPLQGITLQANNSLNQQQQSQKAQLNQSNSKTLINNQQNTYINLHSNQEESSKENERYTYYISKENETSKENLDCKFFESTKINQSAGKTYQKSSQNKVINLNSYQVPSQYVQKQNFENCISPMKAQQQSKPFNTKHLFQSPTISIQSLNGRGLNSDCNYGKTTYRMKTESDAKAKCGNTTEQILSTQTTNDRICDLTNLPAVQSQRSNIKYTLSSQTSIPSSTQIPGQQEVVSFQPNQLKLKIQKLISFYQENNQIINSLSFK
ncbi:hypothetical protein ABPG72_022373 [Tetrahymena utriculariae]